EFNAKLDKMQLADFHGHGFLYKAVWKKDSKGQLLDEKGAVVKADDPDKWKKAVHLKDIHLEKGMHCVDCHFKTDNHGDGKLYGDDKKYERSRLAKTIRRDGKTWGDVPGEAKDLAHGEDNMDFYACHTSWMASCFGCHLPMKANEKRESLHFEGEAQRNWTS